MRRACAHLPNRLLFLWCHGRVSSFVGGMGLTRGDLSVARGAFKPADRCGAGPSPLVCAHQAGCLSDAMRAAKHALSHGAAAVVPSSLCLQLALVNLFIGVHAFGSTEALQCCESGYLAHDRSLAGWTGMCVPFSRLLLPGLAARHVRLAAHLATPPASYAAILIVADGVGWFGLGECWLVESVAHGNGVR